MVRQNSSLHSIGGMKASNVQITGASSNLPQNTYRSSMHKVVFKTGLNTPYVRGEIQTLDPLTSGQKCKIMFFHLIEIGFLMTILAVSSSNQSVTDIVYLLISLLLIFQLSLETLNNDQEFMMTISIKRMELIFNSTIALLIIIVKNALIMSKVLDVSKFTDSKQANDWELYGFRFYQDGTTFRMNWTLTLLSDAIVLFVSLMYLFFLRQVRLAYWGQGYLITRVLRRKIPNNRGQLSYKQIQHQQQQRRKDLMAQQRIEKGNNFGIKQSEFSQQLEQPLPSQTDNKKKSLRRFSSQEENRFLGIKKNKLAQSSEILFKEEKDIIKQTIVNHEYLGEAYRGVFQFVVFLIMLDISAYQTFFQLITYFFFQFLLFSWVMMKTVSYEKFISQNIRRASRFVQGLLFTQLMLIYVLNIPVLQEKFAADMSPKTNKVFLMLGIFYQSDNSDSTGHRTIDFFNGVTRLTHLILCSFIIPMASFLVCSVDKFDAIQAQKRLHQSDIDKKLKERENAIRQNQLTESARSSFAISPLKFAQKKTIKKYASHFIGIDPASQSDEGQQKSDRSKDHASDSIQRVSSSPNPYQNKFELGKKSEYTDLEESVDIKRVSDSQAQLTQPMLNFENMDETESRFEEINYGLSMGHYWKTYLMLWICRANMILSVYIYHNWEAVFLLIWISHSFIQFKMKKLMNVTLYIYMPIMVSIFLFYYMINISQLFSQEFVNQQMIGQYGIFYFRSPILEVFFAQFNLFCLFYWASLVNQLPELEDDLQMQGKLLSYYFCGEDSGTFSNLLLLTFQYVEYFLLFAILLSGLNKVDMYHMIFLVVFLGYLVAPKKKEKITDLVIIYSFSFIIMKHIYTLLIDINYIQYNQDFLTAIGIATQWTKPTEWHLFEYGFKAQQWLVLFAAYFHSITVKMLSNNLIIERSMTKARKNLSIIWPSTAKLLEQIYNLKRNLTLLLIFVIFFFLISYVRRSLIFWGFQIYTLLLIYTSLSVKSISNKYKRQRYYWHLLTVYSSVVFVSNIVFIFCCLPYIKEKPFINQFLLPAVPDWIKQYPDILGFISLEQQQSEPYTAFLPILMFLISSIYVSQRIKDWQKEDHAIEDNIKLLKTRMKTVEVLNISQKSSLDDNILMLDTLTQRLKDLKQIESKIRFSPMFLSYKLRDIWRLIDFFSEYFYIVMYFIVLVLMLFWWFNGSMILQFFTFILLNYRVGANIFSKKNKGRETAKKNLRRRETISPWELQDRNVIELKEEFDKDISNKLRDLRKRAWSFHFLVITLSLIIIYPSQYLLTFQHISTQNEKYIQVAFFRTCIYYMFIGGVYHDSDSDDGEPTGTTRSFSYQISGYLTILALLLIERICLYWLQDKFGCNEEYFSDLKQLSKRMYQVERGIRLLTKQINQKKNKRYAKQRMEAIIDSSDRFASINEEDEENLSKSEEEDKFLKVKEKEQPESRAASTVSTHNQEKVRRKNRIKKLEAKIKKSLEVEASINIMKGFRVVIEDLIILMIWSSALFKMNLHSVFLFVLVIMFQIRRKSGTIKTIMNSILLLFLVRLLLILSNLTEETNFMQFPVEYQQAQWDPLNPDEQWKFLIPWIEYLPDFQNAQKRLYFAQWSYWSTILMFREKFSGFMIDFIVIMLGCIYYRVCQFWVLSSKVRIVMSQETLDDLTQLSKLIDEDRLGDTVIQSAINPTLRHDSQETFVEVLKMPMKVSINSEFDLNEVIQKNGDVQDENPSPQKEHMRRLLDKSLTYKFYKFAQTFANVYYSKLLTSLVLILAIMSSTLFSLGYIVVLCIIMHNSQLSLSVEASRKTLKPIFQKFVMPYMIVEIFCHLAYSIPIDAFDPTIQHGIVLTQLPTILGLHKYYSIYLNNDGIPNLEYRDAKLIQLWFKALVFFFVSIQVQIIKSDSFEELNETLKICKLKGMAMTYHFNNIKLALYFKHQNANLKKEQMMMKVKQKCDKWRQIFEAQAKKDEAQLGVHPKIESPEIQLQDYTPKRKDQNRRSPNPLIDIDQSDSFEEKSENELEIVSEHSGDENEPQESTRNSQVMGSFGNLLQSVNTDYLAIRRLTQNRQSLTFKRTISVGEFNSAVKIERTLRNLQLRKAETFERGSMMYQIYKQKKQKMNICVQFYLKLRSVTINPIYLVNKQKELFELYKTVQMGEVQVKSAIEEAIIKDIKQQIKTGKQTDENYKKETTPYKLLVRFLSLFWNMIMSNFDNISYFFMIITAMANPGVFTLIYPLSVFGYALMEETKPPPRFWFFIMGYTQMLILIEFVLSIIVPSDDFQEITLQYYIGLYVAKNSDIFGLFLHFLPKILVLFSIQTYIQQQVLIDLFEENENQRESIQQGYMRFIDGQFGININNLKGEIHVWTKEDKKELERTINRYLSNLSKDDLQFKKHSEDYEDNSELSAESILHMLTENNINLLTNFEEESNFKKPQRSFLQRLLVENSYIRSVFPALKLQKPGLDYYNTMVFVQVFMALYIILFFPSMDADKSNFIDQVSKNQFSGEMVIVLIIMMIIMIFDRYIYTSKSFVEHGNLQDNDINTKILQDNLKKHYYQELSEDVQEHINHKHANHRIASNQEIKKLGINLEAMLAKTKINFKSVQKLYFQYATLIFFHGLLFFFLPMHGNKKNLNQLYCDLQNQDPCNNFNNNNYIIVFYLLCCLYFWVSALQMRRGLPEVMQVNFMMNRYHWFNKGVFKVFMNIPFLFELRVFIDWTYTKTSLDVFQWIKLAQCQADLFTAKCIQLSYYEKPLGEKIPTWQKWLIGFSVIIFIVVLMIGPMYLFSSFSILGDPNPVSKAQIDFNLNIVDSMNSQQTYKLFTTQNIMKVNNTIAVGDWNLMGFQNDTFTKTTTPDQMQYIIMNNQPQETWIITQPSIDEIVKQIQNALTPSEETPPPLKIYGQIVYSFTRAQPVNAIAPVGSQSFVLLNSTTNSTETLNQLKTALTSDCSTSIQPQLVNLTNSTFGSVLYASQTKDVDTLSPTNKLLVEADWTKPLYLNYTCSSSGKYWNLYQNLPTESREFEVFADVLNVTNRDMIDVSNYGVSFFLLSRRILPSYLNLPLYLFYFSIVYVISKQFRSVFVPITSQIYITDAPDPTDILMLCETIHLYRLKEMIEQEEDLYFLLIDIMRSPQVLKAICGDSIKKPDEKVEEKKKLARSNTFKPSRQRLRYSQKLRQSLKLKQSKSLK